MARGVSISDAEVNRMGVYYSFGEAFGWTPSQVNEIDVYTIQSLAIIQAAVGKEREAMMQRARRR